MDMAESSRLVLLERGGIREFPGAGRPYGLPENAASLRDVLDRLDRSYLGGRFLLVTDDVYDRERRIWHEHPCNAIGKDVQGPKTRIYPVQNPLDFVQGLLDERTAEADIEMRNEGERVVGVYLVRSNPEDRLLIGIGRIIKPQPEGPKVGIGYVHLESDGTKPENGWVWKE